MEYRTIGPKKGIRDGVDSLQVIDAEGNTIKLIDQGQKQNVGEQMKALHAQGKGKGLSFDGTSIQG